MSLRKKLNKFVTAPDEVIDMHGYTTREALSVLDDIAADPKLRFVRIIVGKGIHSAEGHAGVLRDFVKNYLDERQIEHRPAKFKDGGSGALDHGGFRRVGREGRLALVPAGRLFVSGGEGEEFGLREPRAGEQQADG